MRWNYILNIVGILTFFLGLTMLLPLLFGLYYSDQSVIPLTYSIVITVFFGILIYASCKNSKTDFITQREGMAIVAIGWAVVGFFAALPFYFGGCFNTFTDAMFESVSGFTTTGASVLTNIENVSKGLLLWRSFIQWLGGMGIIVLSIAILPFIGVGGIELYKAEVPSPIPDKLKPRIRETSMVLWKVYILLTLLEIFFLLFGGMDFFNALCHSFTTMPTGGFSTKNSSIAYFDSVYIDVVIITFMFLAGINFSLHYQMLKNKPLAIWRDPEGRFFIGLVILLTTIVTLNIYGNAFETIGQSIRFGLFQVVSIITTTGFATFDYEKWPAMSQLILLLCMFLGACAGSTGGGMKCIRIIICIKYCYKELFLFIHPHSVMQIKIGGKSVPENIIRSIIGFLSLYIGLFVISSILLSGMGVDFITSFSAVAAAIGNIGPGFGLVGPVENFANIPCLGKWLLIWCMLLGRLEIYTVIILFVPEFWRK